MSLLMPMYFHFVYFYYAFATDGCQSHYAVMLPTCMCLSPFFHLYLSWMNGTYFNETDHSSHDQVHMALMTLGRSLGWRSRSASDGHRNLPNRQLLNHWRYLNKNLHKCFLHWGYELIRLLRHGFRFSKNVIRNSGCVTVDGSPLTSV